MDMNGISNAQSSVGVYTEYNNTSAKKEVDVAEKQ